jgi:hypothetical protein
MARQCGASADHASRAAKSATKSQIENSPDPEAERARIIAMDQLRDPMLTAEAFGIEEIIDPRDTRPLLCEFANLAAASASAPASWGYRG